MKRVRVSSATAHPIVLLCVMIPAVLTTSLLTLRPFQADDIDAVTALFACEPVHRYICDGEAPGRDVVQAWQARSNELFREVGTGLWVARTKRAHRPMGLTGFFEFFEPPVLEFLFALHPDHFRQGYSRELAGAVLDDARRRVGMGSVQASTDAPNTASVAALKSLGFNRTRVTPKAPHDQWHYVLPLNRPDAE